MALQHKPVVATLRVDRFSRKELCSTETKIRSGKLNGEVAERFRRAVLDQQPRVEDVGTAEAEWTGFKNAVVIMKTAERMCGRVRYGKKPVREEWWWTAIEEKRRTRKELELQTSMEARQRYKLAKTAAKWAVKQAKESVEDDLYHELDDQPLVARKKIYKLVKSRKEGQEGRVASPFINNSDGVLQVEGEAVKVRWREYFITLLNEENPFTAELPTATPVDDPQPGISMAEVKTAISKMKRGKAAGPDEITLEMILALGEERTAWLHRVMVQYGETREFLMIA